MEEPQTDREGEIRRLRKKVRDSKGRRAQRCQQDSEKELEPQWGETGIPEGWLSPWGDGEADGS